MRRKFKKAERNEKRRRQLKRRLDDVITHFNQCEKEKIRTGRTVFMTSCTPEKTSNWRCTRCGLRYTLHSSSKQIEIKGFGMLPEDPNVLDLLTLSQS